MSDLNAASLSQPSPQFSQAPAGGDYRVLRYQQRAEAQRQVIEDLRRQGRSTLTAEILLAQCLQEMERLGRAAH